MLFELSRRGPRPRGILREGESAGVKFLRYAMTQPFAESFGIDIFTDFPWDLYVLFRTFDRRIVKLLRYIKRQTSAAGESDNATNSVSCGPGNRSAIDLVHGPRILVYGAVDCDRPGIQFLKQMCPARFEDKCALICGQSTVTASALARRDASYLKSALCRLVLVLGRVSVVKRKHFLIVLYGLL